MAKAIRLQIHTSIKCFLLIFLCFLLTSAGYLSWVYHLIEIHPAVNLPLQSEIIAYLCQAAGLGIFSFFMHRRPKWAGRTGFIFVMLFYVVLLIPAILSERIGLVLWSGYAANLLCGIIAGYYLFCLTTTIKTGDRAKVFGAGYGISCLVLWLISIAGSFLHMKYSLILYAVLAILAAVFYTPDIEDFPDLQPSAAENKKTSVQNMQTVLFLAFITVIFLSLVKNLGFDFPAEDISAGINLELSRLFYGAGLILAGIINDKSRKYGAVFCLAALIIPFIMLLLSGASVPGLILWSLNYFFFGFFSVYRVILFSDIAERTGLLALAGFGLLSGRIGDAAGTSIYLSLEGNTMILVIITATLFILTVFLFFRLHQQFYTQSDRQKTEQERFEEFATRFSCSQREREVLRLLLKEQTNQEIAAELFVSESTVKFHIHNLLKKTGCKNRIDLLALYHSE